MVSLRNDGRYTALVNSSHQEFVLAVDTIEPLLQEFDPINLSEMEDAALMDRIDTKYVVRISQLFTILKHVKNDYRVLQVQGIRLNRYQTLYYDTPDLQLYRHHHAGRATRYKVRARKYVDSDLSFFEVKHRTNRKRTIKTRLRVPDVDTRLSRSAEALLDVYTPYKAYQLQPQLWNYYTRATLVGKNHPERVTVDINLEFGWKDAYDALPGLAVIEVKQAKLSRDSRFIQEMRRLGIRSTSFSKYCAGVCMLNKGVKANRFKPQLRRVHKLMQEEISHESIS